MTFHKNPKIIYQVKCALEMKGIKKITNLNFSIVDQEGYLCVNNLIVGISVGISFGPFISLSLLNSVILPRLTRVHKRIDITFHTLNFQYRVRNAISPVWYVTYQSPSIKTTLGILILHVKVVIIVNVTNSCNC